jgi:hypothetical protein
LRRLGVSYVASALYHFSPEGAVYGDSAGISFLSALAAERTSCWRVMSPGVDAAGETGDIAARTGHARMDAIEAGVKRKTARGNGDGGRERDSS